MTRVRLLSIGGGILLAVLILSLLPGAALAQGGSGMCGNRYTVVAGDTLSEIAQSNGVSVGALADANMIDNANLIYAGQVLCIPSGTESGMGMDSGMGSAEGSEMMMEPIYGNGYTPRGKLRDKDRYRQYFEGMEFEMEGGSYFIDERGEVILDK